MTNEEILKYVDHTMLSQTASWEDIKQACDDAIKYGTASVCIPPSYVKRAKEYVGDKMPICTVIGFPNGYSTTAVKEFEAKDAVVNGADEIDMVINIAWAKEHDYGRIEDEIHTIKAAIGSKILKVIIETCLLSENEKIELCYAVSEAGADYIKTSTGFSTGGATYDDIELFAKYVKPGLKIKAAGGISSLEDARHFIELGANRLGTSRIVKIIREKQ